MRTAIIIRTQTFALFAAAWVCVISAGAQERPTPPRFTAPFAVRDGIIRDAAGREVRLWGVNYYAPFAHNFLNIAEVGADYRQALIFSQALLLNHFQDHCLSFPHYRFTFRYIVIITE